MNALWLAFLGLGGGGGLLSFGYTIYKDVQSRRQRDQKVEGEIKLDSVTEKRITAEAAQINSDVAIAQQTWWQEQFELLRVELTTEQKARRRITKWAQLHQQWDQKTWELAKRYDPQAPPPPPLEDE